MTKETAVVQAEAVPAFPPKIAEAINSVMKEVPKLNKGEKNQHGRYMFTSIDDFLEAVGPLCAKHGLIVIPDEDSTEVLPGPEPGKEFLKMVFTFRLVHTSGEMWSDKIKRSSFVRLSNGPQATGIAQSYALKNFERSLFQIATGDVQEDVDAHPNDALPMQQTHWHGPLNKTALREGFHAFCKDLQNSMDEESINAAWKKHLDVLNQVKVDAPTWYTGKDDIPSVEARVKKAREVAQVVTSVCNTFCNSKTLDELEYHRSEAGAQAEALPKLQQSQIDTVYKQCADELQVNGVAAE